MRALTDADVAIPVMGAGRTTSAEHLFSTISASSPLAQVEPGLKDRTLTMNGVSKSYTDWLAYRFRAGPEA